MIAEFPICLVTLTESEENHCLTLGLAEYPEGDGTFVIFERSYSFNAQDRRAGLATYSIIVPEDTVHYGGVTSCKLSREQLSLRFDAKAKADFTVEGFDLKLKLDDEMWQLLKDGLPRIFPPKDRPAEFAV
jgi:hypothetical protein